MDDPRFNIFWFLSFVAPALVMCLATWAHRRMHIALGIVLSLVLTYVLCFAAVDRKWNLRIEEAKTEAALEEATADGANIVFTAFVSAPIEAVFYTLFWGFIGWQTSPKYQSSTTGIRRG